MKNKALLATLLFLTIGSFVFSQKKNLNIIYIGDSITQGVQLADPGTEAPPAIATAWLRKQKGMVKLNSPTRG